VIDNRWLSLWLLAVLVSSQALAREKLVPFEKEEKWGYKDSRGRVVIEPRYVVAQEFLPGGIAAVADEKEWSYIDTKGNVVIKPFLFDNGPDYFREGLARFKSADQFGFFDQTGRKVIAAQFDFAAPFSEGLAAVCKAGKWGFIDKKGRIVIPLRFEQVGDFKRGRAPVKLGGQLQSIDKRGRVQ
jgi:hypothetical protein